MHLLSRIHMQQRKLPCGRSRSVGQPCGGWPRAAGISRGLVALNHVTATVEHAGRRWCVLSQGGRYRAVMPICAALNGETQWCQCCVGGPRGGSGAPTRAAIRACLMGVRACASGCGWLTDRTARAAGSDAGRHRAQSSVCCCASTASPC